MAAIATHPIPNQPLINPTAAQANQAVTQAVTQLAQAVSQLGSQNVPQIGTQIGSLMDQKDYTLIIDRSGSMVTRDIPGSNQTRYDHVGETTYALADRVSKHDPDGIDVWFFSGDSQLFRNQTPEKVKQIFAEVEPAGSTNMAGVLDKALTNYFNKRDLGRLKAHGEMIIVITDGAPDDEEAVKRVLVNASLKLYPKDNLMIEFIQVGQDSAATRFMNYLDTQLTTIGAARDFVETVKLEEIEKKGIRQVVLECLAKAPRNY